MRTTTGPSPEIDKLVEQLAYLGYWENRTSSLWLQGRITEIQRLRAEGSHEEAERLRFFAMVLRDELQRVEDGGSI